jgi:hypothetical protein
MGPVSRAAAYIFSTTLYGNEASRSRADVRLSGVDSTIRHDIDAGSSPKATAPGQKAIPRARLLTYFQSRGKFGSDASTVFVPGFCVPGNLHVIV